MSSNKRGRSLAEVMSPIDEEAAADPASSRIAAVAVGAVPERRAESTGNQSIVSVNVLVAPEDRRRLRQLSLDTNLSLQKLGHEAWNMLLQARGLPPLKPVSANVPSGRSTSTQKRP